MTTSQKRILPILVLMIIASVVWFLNFKPGYWLTGWDNLHPEFNFGLNIKRSIFSVWQEYQGLGLLAGMGHASDLPRQIILAIFSIFFPVHWLRSFFVFLMLLIGPIGVYFLLRFLTKDDLSSFFGGLFYLLNLATVQFFYVPFEAFISHYGFLPWFIFLVFNYFETGSKRALFLFFLVSLLGTTQFYVPTLFVVYFLTLLLISLGIFLKEKSKSILKKAFFIFLVTFLVNSFWLLPFFYFSATSASVVGEAQENFMATENVFLRNKEYGKIADVSLLRGFWFEFTDFTKEGKLDYMVKTWRDHLNSPMVLGLGYFQFAIILVGIISQIAKKQKYLLGFFFLFLFSFMILANDTPGISLIIQFFQSKFPLFWQVFRVPFTKFGILAAFSYSIFFGLGLFYVFSKIKNLSKVAKAAISMVVMVPILVFIWPVFSGNLIYKFNQLKIPQEYFELFDFLKEKPLGRIANFPQHSFWGWNYYHWGNVGSGFLWYGIRQPILDRAFDGYSRFNENYYWEISTALYSQNLPLFEKILEKYQISWLLVDGNVISYTSPKSLYFDQLEKLISASAKIKLATSFGKIKIYQVDLETESKDFVFLVQDLPAVGPDYKWNNFDQVFVENGSYFSGSDVYYPFRSLFTGRKQEELEFEIEDKDDYFVFKSKIPKDLAGSKLILPEIEEIEITEIDEEDLARRRVLPPKIYLDKELISSDSSAVALTYTKEGNFEVWVPKIKGLMSYDSFGDEAFWKKEAQTCDVFNQGKYFLEKIKDEKEFLRFSASDSSSCLDLYLPSLENGLGYLITTESRYWEGKSLLFWLENLQSRKADIETYLPKKRQMATSYFVQPPMAQDGLGYSLHFNSISIGRVRSVNDLARVTVNPIPYRFLTGVKIVKS